MALSKAPAIVFIFLLALLMFSLAPADQQPPLPHAQGAEPQKVAAAELPMPPADITKLADAPTEDGFDDQGSGDGNRPFFDDFSWRIFVALNWPAKDGQRGVPDKTKKFGDTTASTVWETWKTAYEIIPPEGQEPTPWDSFEAILPFERVARKEGGKIKVLADITKFQDFHQASLGGKEAPLIDQLRKFVRYETRVNRTEYEFILGKKLYMKEVLGKQNRIKFPGLSIEVKAAWRELPDDAAVRDKFYHRKALVAEWDKDNKINFVEREMGLVGFHIVIKTPQRENWIWSTFEHVDNTESSPDGIRPPSFSSKPEGIPWNGHGPERPKDWTRIKPGIPPIPDPVEVSRNPESDSPPATKEIDKGYREHDQIKKTIWQRYRLVRTQWPIMGSGDPSPADSVANVTMETYRQKMSCMMCHKAAERCHFVFFLEMRVPPPVETRKNLDRILTALERQKDK